jgi:cell shape-determining protein MreC
MRKTFSPKRSLFESLLALSWGGMVVGVALLALAIRLILPNVFWTMTSPLFTVSDALGGVSRSFFGSFGDAASLTLRVDKLTSENTALQDENTTLKSRLETYGALGDRPGIIAGVVARPPQSAYDTLVIAAGTREGVMVGMEAFAQGDVPLGVVDTAWDNFARITLFSAPQRETAGWVGPRSTAITINGLGGGVLRASVAGAANIVVGDVVYVPGPGALPLGRVGDIETNPSSSSVVLRIVSAVNLFNVTWVTLRETGVDLPRQVVATSTQP